jgi:cytoskeletal protein CcmA (bactofilin family)
LSAEATAGPIEAGEGTTVLGPGTAFEGLLTFRGRAQVEGHLTGEIAGYGLLVLAAGASAKARVEVDELVVAG